jgi:hypothetical protein
MAIAVATDDVFEQAAGRRVARTDLLEGVALEHGDGWSVATGLLRLIGRTAS